MGYRGKVEEQSRARHLRASGWTMPDIATELGVSRSSVSLWTRDVPFVPGRRRRTARGPNVLQRRKAEEIERLLIDGREVIGTPSERDLLIAGAALYAGEGFKRDGAVGMANTDPRILVLFCRWLRTNFEIDETRLRVRVYLHEDLDIDEATAYWSDLLQIPTDQFQSPYRAAADGTRRSARHSRGCPAVAYRCSSTHRRIMGLVEALLA